MSHQCPHCGAQGIPDDADLGADFRKKREAAGIGIRAFAKTMGCTRSYISLLELGLTKWNHKWRVRYLAALDT